MRIPSLSMWFSKEVKTWRRSCCQCDDRKESEESGPAEIACATIEMFKPSIERLKFDPVRRYMHRTYWHHVPSLDDAEEGVGHQIYMLHAQGVECGIALVFWFGRQGRIGNGALKHAPIWFFGTVNSSKDADHQDEEGGCPHGVGEEDPHPSCPPHHRHLLRSLQFIFLHKHNNRPHILRLKI